MKNLINIIIIMNVSVSLMMLIRNHLVFRYRHRLLSLVHAAAVADISKGLPWQWRFEAYDAGSYNRMLWMFWRRLGSFYPDKSFLETTEKS